MAQGINSFYFDRIKLIYLCYFYFVLKYYNSLQVITYLFTKQKSYTTINKI